MKLKKSIKLEMYKTLHSIYFWICISLGAIFAVLSAFSRIMAWYDFSNYVTSVGGSSHEIVMDSISLFNSWIGADMSSVGTILFYYLLPLLAIVPNGFSLSREIRSGYIKNLLPKTNRKIYFGSKLISAFIIGGCIITICLLLNIFTISAFVPATHPKVINDMFYSIRHGDMFSQLAYNRPLIFIIVYIFIDFLFSGLFACLPVICAFFTKSGIKSIMISYFFVLSCDLIRSFLFYISYVEISPLKLMHAIPPSNSTKAIVVFFWITIYVLIIVACSIAKGKKYEVL